MEKQPLGTGVIVLNAEKTHVLLGERQNSYKAGTFGLPGGRVEVGEDVESSAGRELQEEAGIKAEQLRYIGVVKELQEGYDFVHFGFVCESFTGEVTVMEPEKCKSWEWFALNNLPEGILPGHLAIIQLYLKPMESNLRSM